MKVLYIDCFGGFDTNMLLGALLDMGASAVYTEQMLRDMGFEADILSEKTVRKDIEAVYAYTKCIQKEDIEDFKYKTLLTNMCDALGEQYSESENICTWAAVLSCMECFGVEKIICSPLSDGSGADASGYPIPSPQVLKYAKNYHIPIRTTDVQREIISSEGIVFIGENADDFGMLPVGNIMCIGYGAGENVDNCINIVRCVLTESEETGIKELEMLLNI